MTCRELLEIEHPHKVIEENFGGAIGCPSNYGYANDPDYCIGADEILCTKCWNREYRPKVTGTRMSNNSHVETETYMVDIESPTDEPHILDSGDRTEFESGAVRDMRVGKGRCDLLPLDVTARYIELYINQSSAAPIRPIINFQTSGDSRDLYDSIYLFTMRANGWNLNHSTMFLEVAKHFEEGAKKYGDDNWKKGIPTNVYIDSAVRHYLKFLRGDKDEPHDRAFCWNILCCIWTCIHKPELNVYRKLEKGE